MYTTTEKRWGTCCCCGAKHVITIFVTGNIDEEAYFANICGGCLDKMRKKLLREKKANRGGSESQEQNPRK